MTDVTIKGAAELQQFLNTLPAKIEGNILRSALRKGAKVQLAYAQEHVPAKTGLLRNGLKIRTRLRAGVASASVVTTGPHAYIAKWVEYGTQAHQISAGKGKVLAFLTGGHPVNSVEHPGARAKPFLRPALDATAAQAVEAVAQQIRTRLSKAGIDLPDEGDGA